jgi:hypothetical protein
MVGGLTTCRANDFRSIDTNRAAPMSSTSRPA